MQEMDVIIKEIKDFVKINGGEYRDYYIGITNDIERRIVETLDEHAGAGRYTKINPYRCWEAEDNESALAIELHFQNNGKGMYGYNPSSKGTDDSRYVYCFLLDDGNKKVLNEDFREYSQKGKETRIQIDGIKEFLQGKGGAEDVSK